MPNNRQNISSAQMELEAIATTTQTMARTSHSRSQQVKEANRTLKIIAVGTTLCSIAIVVAIVYLVRSIVTMISVSFLSAYMLAPVVDSLDRRGINRSLAGVAITLVLLGGFIFISTVAVSGITTRVVKINEDMRKPENREQLVTTAVKWIELMPEIGRKHLIDYLGFSAEKSKDTAEIDRKQVLEIVEITLNKISAYILSESQKIIGALGSSARSVFSAFTTGIILFFMTFFFIGSGAELKKGFMEMVPNQFFEPMLVLLDGIDRQLGDYLRSRLIETILVSLICAVGYSILGLQFAVVLGIIAGLANLIPYIGPFIGAVPALVLLFVGSRYGFGWGLVGIGTVTITVQIIDTAVIFPLLVGKSVELGPITTIVVVLIGDQFLGLIGMLIAVPVTAMLKLVFHELMVQINADQQRQSL